MAGVQIGVTIFGDTPVTGRIGGAQLYALDLVAMFCVGSAIVLAGYRPGLSSPVGWAFLAMLLPYGEFIRGLIGYGVYAGVDFRSDAVAFGVLVLAAQTKNRYSPRNLAVLCGILAIGALVIYLLRYTGLARLSEFDLKYNVGTFRGGRFVAADQALAIAIFGIAAVGAGMRFARPGVVFVFWTLGVIALAVAFASMHRSVWAVMLVVLPLFVFLQWRARLISLQVFVVIFTVSSVLVLATLAAVNMSDVLQQSIEETTTPQSTLIWRIEGWTGLFRNMSGTDFVVGRGYGSDYSRIVFGQIVKWSAHNFYVGKLYQCGALAVLVYIPFALMLMFSLYRIAVSQASTSDRSLATILLALIVGSLSFFNAYEMAASIALVFGYSAGFVREQQIRAAVRSQRSVPLSAAPAGGSPRLRARPRPSPL